MRQVRRLAYRTRHVLRRPPPPRWRAPALYGLVALSTVGLLVASVVIAKETGLTDRARFAAYDRLVAVTDGINRLFANDILPLKLAREAGLAIVDRLPPAKRFFMRHAMGLLGELPRLMRGEPL